MYFLLYKRIKLPVFTVIFCIIYILMLSESAFSINNKSGHNMKTNRLIHEKSPYLLQHADNPVDWYPWGEDAFKKALEEDKPIFLSIGYSTCHWCHVMEHESFEDLEVAHLLNDTFVCIKVDREERPDIDSVYMAVCQMLTGSGGWPLTIIMTPEKKPFYAGTYFPKESRFGRPGMLDLIPRIKSAWQTERQKIISSAEEIAEHLKKTIPVGGGDELPKTVLDDACSNLALSFDTKNGGFGSAPKFPMSQNLFLILRHWKRTNDQKALEIVKTTLKKMRQGGIYDHVGFGFHRYSTDEKWLVPHFEKMLYDQALIAFSYIEAYQATNDPEFASTADEIFTYVLRDMTSKEGGFYSAEDADSQGEEGKFYLWTTDEIRRVLVAEDSELIINAYNLDQNGNFSDEATRVKSGKNILHLTKPLNEIAATMKISEDEFKRRLSAARVKLFTTREKRVHPGKDDKILTDWNGLMIASLAKGGRVLGNDSFTKSAEKAAQFILANLRKKDGRLLHRYRDGSAAIQAHLDDYAFFIWGLLELYETTFNVFYLKEALTLTDVMLNYFWDDGKGGLFSTADDAEKLLVRQKESYDGAIPSGNSVAMLNLIRLSRITADEKMEEKAELIPAFFSSQIERSPSAHCMMLTALDFAFGPSFEIVISGKRKGKDTEKMLGVLRSQFVPNKVVLFHPEEQEEINIEEFAPFTKNQMSIDGKATAYVCKNYSCLMPVTETKKMLELLGVKK